MVDIQVHRPPLIWDIATSLPVATMLVGPDDSVIFANPMWVDMTGIDENDALGDGWKRALSPRDARMASRLVHGAVRDAAPATARFRIETSSGPQTTVWHFAVHRTAIDDCRAIIVVHPSSRPIPQRTPQPEGLTTIDEFFDAVDNALRGAASRQRVAMVMSVRVDGIDEIRRMHGNVAADGVTSVVLDRLRASLRPGDVAAQPAPSELVILCADVPSPTDAARVAARLNTALRAPVRLGASEYHVGPNIGVATGTSATTGRTELYARSSEAMKVAAAAGGGVVIRGATPDAVPDDIAATVTDDIDAYAERLRDLEQKLEEKTLLLGQLDHVLKSSFTVVMGWADMLSDRWSDLTPDRRRQGVAAIRDQSHRIVDTAEALLADARLEREPTARRRATTDIAELVRSAVAERQGMTKEVAIDLDVAGDVPTVETDPSVVRLILIELLDNAMKYSSGDAPVVVRVNRSGDGDVLIDVENEGVALDSDIDPFAPFARGREARRLAGSGLGLFIAKRLSGHIAAELTAHSRPSGARFALWIPGGGGGAPAT